MACLICVASLARGRKRSRGQGEGAQHFSTTLTPATECLLLNRLDNNGINYGTADTMHGADEPDDQALSIIAVRVPGQVVSRFLDLGSPEKVCIYQYLHDPRHEIAVFDVVAHVCPETRDGTVMTMFRGHKSNHKPLLLSARQTEILMDLPCLHEGIRSTVRAWRDSLQATLGVQIQDVAGFAFIWRPIIQLIALGHWHTLG
eukprot:4482321-Lingulodinium_polyedra.AAC.1